MNKLDLIRKVTPLPGWQLRVVMGSGNMVELDFQDKLDTIRFWDLRDPAIFNTARAEGDFLVFSNGLKIGASEICDMMMLPKNWNDYKGNDEMGVNEP